DDGPGDGDGGQAIADAIDAEHESEQRQSGQHEADELGEADRVSILQLSCCSDPRPDEASEDLRPHGPVHAHERGEPEHGNLGGKQPESQGSSGANGEQHDGEHAGRGCGAESEGARIDLVTEWTRGDADAAHAPVHTGGCALRCFALALRSPLRSELAATMLGEPGMGAVGMSLGRQIGPEFRAFDFTHDGRTYEVFRGGSGPAVLVLHEIPGLHPGVIDFARRLIDAGYTVYLPSLYGRPAAPAHGREILRSIVQVCAARESS